MQNNHYKSIETLNHKNLNHHKNHHIWPHFHQFNHNSKISIILYKLKGHRTDNKNGVRSIMFVGCSNYKNGVAISVFPIYYLRLKLVRFAFT